MPYRHEAKKQFWSATCFYTMGRTYRRIFPATIEIKGIDGVGVLNHITKVISEDLAINIRNLSIESNDGLFTGKLGIMVHDVQDIEKLCNNIKKVKEVKSAVRVKNI